jgi:hypothetical protein
MNKIFLLVALIMTFASCTKKDGLAPGEESSVTDPPSDPIAVPLTPDQMFGSHYAPCLIATGGAYGTDVNGMSFLRSIHMNTNNTYSVTVMFFTGTVCHLGGTQIFNYTQNGSFTTGNVTTTPANATEVAFTVTNSSLTIYAGSGVGSTWAGYFNSYCPGGPTNFSTVATSSRNEAGYTCMHVSNPAFVFPTFPTDGSTTYDVISLDSVSNPTNFITSSSINLFYMGQSASYPTTQTMTYAF